MPIIGPSERVTLVLLVYESNARMNPIKALIKDDAKNEDIRYIYLITKNAIKISTYQPRDNKKKS